MSRGGHRLHDLRLCLQRPHSEGDGVFPILEESDHAVQRELEVGLVLLFPESLKYFPGPDRAIRRIKCRLITSAQSDQRTLGDVYIAASALPARIRRLEQRLFRLGVQVVDRDIGEPPSLKGDLANFKSYAQRFGFPAGVEN